METFLGIMIPFLGTALGAACVFFMKKSLGDLVQRALAGFAAGVMVAASIWSLLIPAIEQSEDMGKLSFLPAFIGFWVGVLFLLLLDHLIPHLHVGSNQAEGPKSRLGRTTMMVLAVTLHNIPEGMAVGLAFALAAEGEGMAGAAALALGIGIQNLHGIPAKGPPARERPVVVADRGQGPCRRLSPVKRLFLARTAAAGNTLPRCRGSRPRLRAAGQKAGGRTCPATAGTGPSPSAVRILSRRTRT